MFPAQFREIEKQSRNVSTWSRDTRHKSGLNRISLQVDTNDRDGLRRVSASLEGPGAASENCIHLGANEFRCQLKKAIRLAMRISMFKTDIPSLGVPASLNP